MGADFHEHDLFALSAGFVDSLFVTRRPRILAGCAPCQPYSAYTNGRCHPESQWQLLDKFAALVKALRPEVVTMENVSLLVKHDVFSSFVSALQHSGYRYSYSVVRCSDYGVPQRRRRLVLLASTLGDIELEAPVSIVSEATTVEHTIGRLEPLKAGEASESDPLHRCSGLSERNLRRIRSSKPGGTWRDWEDDLRAACHSRNSGRTYPGVYGRMRWDDRAPTITTQFHGYGSGRFGHPDQDRAISLREGALLQTFPEHYSFVPQGEAVRIGPVARLIGNAVPVRLGAAIGRSIIAHLETFT